MSAKKNKRTHLDCSNVETNIKPATSNEQFLVIIQMIY